jgi:predicted nucleic acid-binding protein
MNKLLVSDANVIIDIEIGDLTKYFFLLPYEIVVPDVLFEEELRKRHEYLLDFGLKTKILESEYVAMVFTFAQKYRNPSRNDLFALALALQEKATLLTGDKPLREAAKKEQVHTHGTIWVVTEMIRNNIITIGQAEEAFILMQKAGSRLPKGQIQEELEKLKKAINDQQVLTFLQDFKSSLMKN